jgi:hypothetical protein
MRLNGWQRLYIVAMLAWGVFLAAMTYLLWQETVGADFADLARSFALIWIVSGALVYAFGAGVAWICRGFRND